MSTLPPFCSDNKSKDISANPNNSSLHLNYSEFIGIVYRNNYIKHFAMEVE